MDIQTIKRIIPPTIIGSGLLVGVLGTPGVGMTALLDAIEKWSSAHFAYPAVFYFFAGLGIAWLIYAIVVW